MDYEIFEKKHEKGQDDRDNILKSQQKALEDCINKLDVIFDMRLNGKISTDEFKTKKEQLVSERIKFEELIKDTGKRVDKWLDTADKLFSFSEAAKQKFENGDMQMKKDILSCLGSNFTL